MHKNNVNINVMKKLLVLCLVCFLMQTLKAQTKDYRVVFDLTSKDSLNQAAVMRWINEISAAEPNAQIEVVMYGQGISMVTKGRSYFEEAVLKFTGNKSIAFKACAVALKNQNIDKSQLLPGIEIVPDGIYEIISKQREGWGYIKAVAR